jgi:hypothetical protein
MTAPVPPLPSDRSAADRRYRIFVGVGLLVAAAAMAAAVIRTQTDEETPATQSGRRDVVEHLKPFQNAQVLRQAEMGADLAPGYEGTLIVNDIPIPQDQLRLVPEQNEVYFTPGDGKVIEELPGGRTCVVVVAWQSSLGRGADDQRTRWCFDVS